MTTTNKLNQTAVSNEKINSLIKKLDSDVSSVRKKAKESLIRTGEPAVAPLLNCLEEAVYLKRIDVLDILKSIGKPAVGPVVSSFNGNINNSRLSEALTAIGEPAFPALMELLENRNGKMRSAGAEVLGNLGDCRAVEPLIRVLLTDGDCGARANAAKALGNMKCAGSSEALIRGLGDKDSTVRRLCARALGYVGGAGAVDPLIKLLTDEYRIRAEAAEALARIRDVRAVGPMIEVLDSRGGGWYWSADTHIKAAILKFRSKRTALLLFETFRGDNKQIKEAACELLAKMGNYSLGVLNRGLEDGDVECRYYSAVALGMKQDKRCVKLLRGHAEDEAEDSDVRRAALRALNMIIDGDGSE